MKKRLKTSRLEIRLLPHQKKFIRMMAEKEDKNLTDFLLDSVYKKVAYEKIQDMTNEKR